MTDLDDTERLSEAEKEAMERAARNRDPRWDTDPPLNRSLYREGWADSRSYQQARIGEVEARRNSAERTAHAHWDKWQQAQARVKELEAALREIENLNTPDTGAVGAIAAVARTALGGTEKR